MQEKGGGKRGGTARKKNEHHQFIVLAFKIKTEEIYNTTP